MRVKLDIVEVLCEMDATHEYEQAIGTRISTPIVNVDLIVKLANGALSKENYYFIKDAWENHKKNGFILFEKGV